MSTHENRIDIPARLPTSSNRSLTPDQIRQWYLVEKDLAERLQQAPREQRAKLYTEVYQELFERVPFHPQITGLDDPAERALAARRQILLLKPFLNGESSFLEIGAGDAALSAQVAPRVRTVYALDVTDHLVAGRSFPANFEFVVSDGAGIPLPENSIDVAYSNQLMEHVHPDDAREQLQGIWRCLVEGGRYVLVTPNRYSGPHDVSAHFDEVATGFHLREYSFTTLRRLLREVGFTKVRPVFGGRGVYISLPGGGPGLAALEAMLGRLPFRLRRMVANWLLVRAVLGIYCVAQK